jgi:hypothetical protein
MLSCCKKYINLSYEMQNFYTIFCEMARNSAKLLLRNCTKFCKISRNKFQFCINFVFCEIKKSSSTLLSIESLKVGYCLLCFNVRVCEGFTVYLGLQYTTRALVYHHITMTVQYVINLKIFLLMSGCPLYSFLQCLF